MDHLRPVAVPEPDLLEADVPGDVCERLRARRVDDVRLFFEDVHDLVERGRRGQVRVVELRQVLHGIEEVRQVADEGEQRADGDVAARDEVAAVAEDDRGRGRGDEVDRREVDAAEHDGAVVRLPVVGVDLVEVRERRVLTCEGLEDAHARDVFGQRRGDEPQALPDGAVGEGRARAEHRRGDDQRRHHRERREREPPVEEEQDHDRAEQQQRVLQQRRHAFRHQLVERVDVVRQPADDDACAVALVVAERQALEMAEEAVAQVREDALSRPACEVRLCGAGAEVDEPGHHECAHDPAERREVAFRDAVVDGELGEIGRRERGHRGE